MLGIPIKMPNEKLSRFLSIHGTYNITQKQIHVDSYRFYYLFNACFDRQKSPIISFFSYKIPVFLFTRAISNISTPYSFLLYHPQVRHNRLLVHITMVLIGAGNLEYEANMQSLDLFRKFFTSKLVANMNFFSPLHLNCLI